MDYNMDFTGFSDSFFYGFLVTYSIYIIILLAFLIIVNWKLFTKAGEAGWKSLIPIYNTYIRTKIAYGGEANILIFILSIFPLTSVIGLAIVAFKIAKRFGAEDVMAVLNILFRPIIETILAFSTKYQYHDLDNSVNIL